MTAVKAGSDTYVSMNKQTFHQTHGTRGLPADSRCHIVTNEAISHAGSKKDKHGKNQDVAGKIQQ